jgi:predicted transcriptional regulator
MKSMQNLTIRVDRELRSQIDRLADDERRSASNLVRLLLSDALARRLSQTAREARHNG